MRTKYNMTQRDLALWQNNKTKHTQAYLMPIPKEGLDLVNLVSAILGYRPGVPLFAKDSLCSCCGNFIYVFGDHGIHCTHEVGLKFFHDIVRDTLSDICFRVGVQAKTEASLGFLANDGGEARPADILVLNRDNGRDTCFVVTGVSPFTGNGVKNFCLVWLFLVLPSVSATSILTSSLGMVIVLAPWLLLLWASLVKSLLFS